jgi:predicted amidohydrolase
MSAHTLRIALLHLAPIPGDITMNRQLVEKAVNAAARLGATWIITPNLLSPAIRLPTASGRSGFCRSQTRG